jgi:flagellin
MPQIINTNILAMNAQRQLNKTQSAQTTAIERLSSGLRINGAKDDAAGLAISTRFETQVRGLNQAVRNANDGISLTQTAEGSMSEMSNILQRMRELAVQSANGTNSDADRTSIQAEVDQLYSEIDRIAETTQFNGVNLLDGSSSNKTFQIGANSGQTVSFSLDSVTAKDLNLNGFSALGTLNGGRVGAGLYSAATLNSGDIVLNGIALASFTGAGSQTIDNIEKIINDKTGQHGVTATAYNVVSGGAGVTGVTSGVLIINGTSVTKSSSMQELVDNINRDIAGVTAAVGESGKLVLSNDTGSTIIVNTTSSATDLTDAGLTAGTYTGYLALSSQNGEAISITTDSTLSTSTASQVQLLGLNISEGPSTLTGGAITGANISTSDGIEINGVSLGKVQNGTSSAVNSADIAFAINAITEESGVTATAETEVKYNFFTALASSAVFTINQVTVSFTTAASATTINTVVSRINSLNIQGITASADVDTGQLVLSSATGLNIEVTQTLAGNYFSGVTTSAVTYGTITLDNTSGGDVIITSSASAESLKTTALAKLGYVGQGGDETAVGTGLDVTTAQNASNSIERIDEALSTLSSSRAKLGAIQNRLGSTISNLENVSQNLSAANSRIRDADFASETSTLTKSQVLQQAGIAMLAQANASQQSVLSLLQ